MIQTWEHRGVTFTNKDRYLVRSTFAPGLCDACAGTLERQRLAADLLSLVPLVALFFVLVFSESKLVLGALLAYLVYLGRYLDYTWADGMVYGAELLEKVQAFVPEGDAGQVYLPVSWLHMGVRIAAIPVALVGLLTAGSVVLPFVASKPVDAAASAASPRAARTYPKDRLAHARQVLAEEDFAVPVKNGKPGFYTQPMGGQPVQVLRVKVAAPASGQTKMTGRQLADAFLTVTGDSMLVIDGAGDTVAMYRFEVERMRAALAR